MGIKCGIVGLPNVGKSTLFNALTKTAAAQAANYPFCTIEPNTGDVAVPDKRLKQIASIAGSKEIIPTLDTRRNPRPPEFFSCFISHATADTAFAEKLYQDLQREQVRCWYAPADLHGGEILHDQIRRAIQTHDKLLLILSARSINSQWVETEIWEARQQELTTGQRKLFPVSLIDYATLRNWRCFDGDTGRDLAREVRGYFIPDFSTWKDHDAYQAEFQKLLRDLKSNQTTP